MSLLGKLEGKTTDDVLLLHGMLLMCAADGVMEQSEQSTLEAFYNTLPEFQGKDFDQLLAEANRVVARYGNLRESLNALAEIERDTVRRKCFVLAVDIALSSGQIPQTEQAMLGTMQRILGIDDELAAKVFEVLALKYAR